MSESNGDKQPQAAMPESKIRIGARKLGEKLRLRRSQGSPKNLLGSITRNTIPEPSPEILHPTPDLVSAQPFVVETIGEPVEQAQTPQQIQERIAKLRGENSTNIQLLNELKAELVQLGGEDLGFPSDIELRFDVDRAKRDFNWARENTDEYREANGAYEEAAARALRRNFSGDNEEYSSALQRRNDALDAIPANPSSGYIESRRRLQEAQEKLDNQGLGRSLHAVRNSLDVGESRTDLHKEMSEAEENPLKELSDEDLLYGIKANTDSLRRYEQTCQDGKSVTVFLISLQNEAQRRKLNVADAITASKSASAEEKPKPIQSESKGLGPKPPSGLENLSVEELNSRLANLDKSGLDAPIKAFLKRSMEKELEFRKSGKVSG